VWRNQVFRHQMCLGYYHIYLVDINTYRDRYIDRIRGLKDARQSSNNLVDAGIEAVLLTWPVQSDIVAVSSAGWSRNLRSAQQSGFMKIDGKEVSEFEDRESLNSIICLSSPLPTYKDFEYQVPILLRTEIAWQLQANDSCKDSPQVGPSIIERHIKENIKYSAG